jgi:hypothetical protein
MLFAGRTSTVDLCNTKIAITLNENYGDFIWVIDHDGSKKTKLTQGVTPCWSPDGLQITSAAEKNGNWDIYYMNADGADINIVMRKKIETLAKRLLFFLDLARFMIIFFPLILRWEFMNHLPRFLHWKEKGFSGSSCRLWFSVLLS